MTVRVARRDAILDLLTDHVLAHGLAASSLRPLAEAARTSDRMLLYYFEDKSALIAATLERVAERLTNILDRQATGQPLALDALTAKLSTIVMDEALWPYMRLWLEIAALAARGDQFYRAVGAEIGRGFLRWGEAQLASPTPEDRARDAARLIVTIEGMLVLNAVGLGDIADDAIQASRSIA